MRIQNVHIILKMMIKAEIIADSRNMHGQRLTTFVLCFPRIVLAEFNTHRVLSKNSASSRAIPFEKMVKMVKENPFIPIKWMKEHKGMQGTEYFTTESDISWLKMNHLKARDQAVERAMDASERGLTKQICNRYLEPFMWHTVIVTGTEWENFFALRAHPQAEIHIQALAHAMLDTYNATTPRQLYPGDWHIPFGDVFDITRSPLNKYKDDVEAMKIALVKIATARCARVSYLNFEGKDDYEADIILHDRLLESGHMSPFEHCARAMSDDEYYSYCDNCHALLGHDGRSGNFVGFVQYRKMLGGENKKDERVKKQN